MCLLILVIFLYFPQLLNNFSSCKLFMLKDNKKKKLKTTWKKVWYFIWDDDSIWSWVVNVVIAFVLIKYVIYPGLGLVLGTTHPVVAVVSGSMEHKTTPYCIKEEVIDFKDVCVEWNYKMCNKVYDEKQKVNFDFFWEECGDFYREHNINKLEFQEYPFKNGFNTGDIMVLLGKKPEKINIGDVIVFKAEKPDPIIHRVIKKWGENNEYYFTTKGDHNPNIISNYPVNEAKITENRIIGKAVFKIPYLGYIKIWFVELLKVLNLDKTIGGLFN